MCNVLDFTFNVLNHTATLIFLLLGLSLLGTEMSVTYLINNIKPKY